MCRRLLLCRVLPTRRTREWRDVLPESAVAARCRTHTGRHAMTDDELRALAISARGDDGKAYLARERLRRMFDDDNDPADWLVRLLDRLQAAERDARKYGRHYLVPIPDKVS